MEKYSDPDRIFNYKYQSENHSIFAKFLKYWWAVAFKLVPLKMSANLLSLIGNIGSWGALFVLIFWGASHGRSNPWIFALAAFGVLFYHTVDCIDGMQARRIKSAGPLGEFVDHWFDSFNIFFFPLGAIAAFPDLNSYAAVVAIVLCGLADWMALKVVTKTNVMYFWYISPFEGITIYWMFLLAVAVTGYNFWLMPILPGFSLINIMLILTILNFAMNLVKSLHKVGFDGWQVLLGELLTCAPIILWIFSAQSVLGDRVALIIGLLAIGFTASRYAGDLLRHRLLGLKIRVFYPDAVILVIGLVAVSIASLFVRLSPLVMLVPMILYYLDLVICLLLQFFRTTDRVYKYLGIRLFGLPNKEQAGQLPLTNKKPLSKIV